MTSNWENCTKELISWFENSKYIKNLLYAQKLSQEYIDTLILTFYHLITGPLTLNNNYFPVPQNICLANCLDAAGVVPHQKLLITEMIWPTIKTKEWIDSHYNQFYTIRAEDLNSVQKQVWSYIRELVLSVSLYNRTLEKNLTIFSISDIQSQNIISSSYEDGIYITYEEELPLILIFKNKGWVFKDLYALLYHHLQLSGDQPT